MTRVLPVMPGPDGTFLVYMNKIEIGQGVQTAIAQIAAEELNASFDRIRVVAPDTSMSLEGASTTGSNSIQGLGRIIRQAAADLRHHLLNVVAEAAKVPVEDLALDDGVILLPGGGSRRVEEVWSNDMVDTVERDVGQPKPSSAYTIVGSSVPRTDLPGKVAEGGHFIQDLRRDDMLHGRVIRPPTYDATLKSFDPPDVDGVRVIRDGSFLGLVGEDEQLVERVATEVAVTATWDVRTRFPEFDHLYDHLLSQPDEAFLVVDGKPGDDPVPEIAEPEDAVKTIRATFKRPYQMHGALAPSASMAVFENDELTVWSHSQGVFSLRGALAQVLDLDPDAVRVIHAESSGCYGHNGADDVSLDAALLARAAPGRPVLVKWSREDEHRWEPYGSCAVLKLQGSVDRSGTVIDWNHDVWSYTHSSRPRSGGDTSSLLAARYLEHPVPPPVPRPGKGSHSGIHRNADPLYAFSRRRVVKHFVRDSPLRVSALRGLGAFANVFAIESFMDELALAADIDAVDFRVRHLEDDRAVAVLRTVAEHAGWGTPLPSDEGRGIGFAQYKNEKAYVAVCAHVKVERDTGRIRLLKMTIAGDVGQVINPDGVKNQLEGGVIQAASWTLWEEVTFNEHRITSVDWETYPVLRFEDVPEVETVLIDRPGLPSLGCGEATQGPTPAAIANAVYDAVGVRLRQIPFTPERVRSAIENAS